MISSDSSSTFHSDEQDTAKPSAQPGWGWMAVAIWIGVIFFSSTSLASKWAEAGYRYLSGVLFDHTSPNYSPSDLMHLIADKGFHVGIFCVLAALLWLTLPSTARRSPMILLCGLVVGSCSEFLQRFFPDRDPALHDVVINTAGTALGILICFALEKLNDSRLRSSKASID